MKLTPPSTLSTSAPLTCFIWLAASFLWPCLLAAQSSPTGNQVEWEKLQPTGARAKFEMPIKPRFVERSFAPVQDKPPVKVRLHLATVNQGKTTYIFGYHDLHDPPKDQRKIDATLEGFVQGAVGNVLGQLLKDPKKVKYKEHQGRQFEYHFSQNEQRYIVKARVFLVGKRQYQLNVVMAADSVDLDLADKFLSSFVIIVPQSDSPPRPRESK